MTPQEKAKELVSNYIRIFQKTDSCFGECKSSINCQLSWYACEEWLKYAKECALITVDEILDVAPVFYDNINIHASEKKANETSYEYWIDVKQEIEKL